MAMCPKCRKQNPSDAAFCGFCGAALAQSQPSGGPAKTVFGYNLDPAAIAASNDTPTQENEPVLDTVPIPQEAPPAPKAALAPTLNDAVVPMEGEVTSTKREVIANKYIKGELKRQLATGDLFMAKDQDQDLDLELFIVNPDVFPSPLDMERARRELRQLQKVDSAAIVKVLDQGKLADGRLYVALEATVGTSLDEVVSAGPMGLEEAQRIITAVGTGLAEAQKMGVIHRDIAPHNISVSDQGVKIRGFGIAAPVKQNIFGTPAFMSPEQATGRPVDQRSNIYSLGALMYFMLTQHPPFEGDSADDLLSKHQQAEPVSPKKAYPQLAISEHADVLILKALAKSSSRRHLTLRQFLREVDSLSKKSSVPAPQAPPMSFVTPVHGVTALTGGERPPSAEMSKVEMGAGAPSPVAEASAMAPTPAANVQPAAIVLSTAPAQYAPQEPAAPSTDMTSEDKRKTIMDSSSSTLAPDLDYAPMAPVKQTVMDSSPETVPPAHAVSETPPPAKVTHSPRGKQATGELSSAASLTSPPPSAEVPAAPRKPVTRPPAPQQPVAGAGSKKSGGGFRETMWFFKGEVESAMAETSEEDAPPPAEDLPGDLAVKYADDGSMSEEEARRLSLRTGKTQMMAQVKIPSGNVPGQQMKAEEFIHELNHGKRIAIWSGIFVVVAGLTGLVVWLVMS